MQLSLHKKLRSKIREWENEGLLPKCETELTYHTKSGYLQVVLNLPNIKSSPGESKELSEAQTKQIPKKIDDYILNLSSENHIDLKRDDHGKEMDCERKSQGKDYWCGMRNEEIVGVCSNCTWIASEILDKLEKDRDSFKDDLALRDYIKEEIVQRLGFPPDLRDCRFERAWHETCNSVGLGIFQGEDLGLWFSGGNRFLGLVKARSLDCKLE